MDPVVHPDPQPLAFLLVTWRGGGEGKWPPAAGPTRHLRGEPRRT